VKQGDKIRITAVSYTNTIPFIFGLNYFPGMAGSTELTLLPPAMCAEAWISGDADIALVPVGAMDDRDLDLMCCEWCIGAENAVESVLLLSHEPVDQLSTIFLDTESRTSVLMTSILCKHHWHISPELKPLTVQHGYKTEPHTGMVLIGDKTFGLASEYPYVVDLASAWQQMTGLPAVFACWLTRERVPLASRMMINEALAWGVAHIPDAVSALLNSQLNDNEAIRYLTQCISFRLGEQQKEAIHTFFALRNTL